MLDIKTEEKMCERCQKIINKIWPKIQTGRQYWTPDLYKRKEFCIEEKSDQKIKIKPQNISITKKSFLAALHYLIQNEQHFKNQIEIRSSNSRKSAGPFMVSIY